MTQVLYALREDPNSIFLLQDAGRHYDKYCQITVFGRNIIRPEFFKQYMYFAPFTGVNGKYRGGATELQISIEDNEFIPKQNYVAVIDSEVEFRVTQAVIRQLSKEYMPAWGVKSYLDYFSDRRSGIILFLRVYKVNQSLPQVYLNKGIRGSSQVIKLYDEYEEEISLPVDGMEPVISENKFLYLKDEILHLLKVENSLIALYDSTESGLSSLQERVIADRHIQATHQRWENRNLQWLESDEDTDFDMAQLDYESIYRQVLEICPGMKNVIDYVRKIQAARLGEYDYCLNDIHSHSGNESVAFNRLFDMTLRATVKNALYYHQKNNLDISDAFQVACIGVIIAIRKHNENVEGLFPSYASMWMRQVLSRELPIYESNVRIPVHYSNRIDQVLQQMSKTFERSDLSFISHNDLYNAILNSSDCDKDEAYKIAYLINPAESIEEILEDPVRCNIFQDESNFENEIVDRLSLKTVYDALNSLKSRERDVIAQRYGFDGYTEASLEEIGGLLGITRERVRQIEEHALRKIVDYLFREHFITKKQYDSVIDENNKKRLKARKKKQYVVTSGRKKAGC